MGTSGNPAKKTKTTTKPLTFDHLRSGKKPITKTVYVCLDNEVAEAYDEAKQHVDALGLRHRAERLQAMRYPEDARDAAYAELDAEMAAARDALDAAEAAYDEATVAIRLRSIGRLAFEEMWNAHPPTEEQNAEVRKQLDDPNASAPYNADTFAPALISACAIEPEMTPEEVAILFEEWNGPEVALLFGAAMDVCQRSQVNTLGKGFGRTNGSRKN